MTLKPYLADLVQVSFLYHKLHRFYAKSAHQLLRSFAATHMSEIANLFLCGMAYSHVLQLQLIHDSELKIPILSTP